MSTYHINKPPPLPEAEQDERQPGIESQGMSLEDAIHEFVRIRNRQLELDEERKRIMEILIPAALEAKQDKSNTCRLANHNGRVVLKAEFKSYVRCDTENLNTVREILGDDVFERLFKTEYKPLQAGLKPFLATKTTDEAIETAKVIINGAVRYSPPSPQFTIEKGEAAAPVPWE